MVSRITTRKIFIAAALVFAATTAVLLFRQFNLTPARPSPDFRAFGPKDAPIQIYEYTDFACPACKAAEAHVMYILKTYKDSVRINFKHYPLSSIHPWSFMAASYADCAGEQGKFVEYASLLFESQEKWARAAEKPGEFTAFAAQLKLDAAALETCAASVETARRVKLDVSEGDLRNVNATPTFFINGKRAVGGPQFLTRFDTIFKDLK